VGRAHDKRKETRASRGQPFRPRHETFQAKGDVIPITFLRISRATLASIKGLNGSKADADDPTLIERVELVIAPA
jgi:hypothetical protein